MEKNTQPILWWVLRHAECGKDTYPSRRLSDFIVHTCDEGYSAAGGR